MRLIDADALLEKVWDADTRCGYVQVVDRSDIENAPTIEITQKSESYEDAVSRKDAIRWVKTECNPYGKPTLDFESGKKVIEHLKCMSPVTPRREMGKWIQNDNGTYSCSLCHSWIPEEQHYYAQYCLHCGADMRGEKI